MQIKNQEFNSKIIGKLKKVFDVKEEKTHHLVYNIYYKGKWVAKTYRSHGGGDMSDKAVYGIRRQLFLNTEELANLKNCPLTAEAYLDLLKQKNVISD